jgi:hypothetical protein
VQKLAQILFALATIGGAAAAPVAAASAAPLAGGAVQLWITVTSSTTNSIVITGAIGDYGTVTAVDKNGKVDGANGDYLNIALKKGSIFGDATAYYKLHPESPYVWNAATCAGTATATGTVKLTRGSGAYAGISGVITVTTTYAVIAVVKNGRCDEKRGDSDAALYGTRVGTGTVSF